jgi:uncharacterized metal-binding protein YceD (DUF177 family)
VTDYLDWTHNVADIPAGGLKREREASESERREIAQALGLLALDRVSARYRIAPIGGGTYRLSGTIGGDVVQACVVSLEPVEGKVDAAFDVEFRPHLRAGQSDEKTEADASILDAPEVEKIERGAINAGRIVFETLASSLNPYPRRPDATFEWQDPTAGDSEKINPFGALAKLRNNE